MRAAGGRLDDLNGLARELIEARVDVLVTASSPATRAAMAATATTPIVIAVEVSPLILALAEETIE